MSSIRMLFHVHTRASFDCLMSPRAIVAFCRRNGIQALAITDHDTDASVDETIRHGKDAGVVVVPAVEHSTMDGDIVGLFHRAPLPRASANDTIRRIHEGGGLAVLVHPAEGHSLSRIDVSQVDLVETFNARCSPGANEAAGRLAAEHGKPVIAGADAHLPWDLGSCFNELAGDGEKGLSETAVRQALKRGVKLVVRRTSPYLSLPVSQMIRAGKQRRPGLFFRQLVAIGNHYVLDPLRGRGLR